jgi:hypothetical protein
MPLIRILDDFKTSVAQCESLASNAHKMDAAGAAILSAIDRQQITVAAFLNMFIAWETFLELSLADLMTGNPTINGNMPVKYVSPPNTVAASALVIGVMRFFDYANHVNVKKLINMYFQNGYPYEPHLSAIEADLNDIRAMRNASAHISSTTQTAIDSLALRIFGAPSIGISLYQLLTSVDPRGDAAAGETVFVTCKNKLIVTAELIARG